MTYVTIDVCSFFTASFVGVYLSTLVVLMGFLYLTKKDEGMCLDEYSAAIFDLFHHRLYEAGHKKTCNLFIKNCAFILIC